MRRLTIAEFHAELKAQGVERGADHAVICPMCKTVQSMRDFVAAGASVEQAERQIAFSCIGRWRPNVQSGLDVRRPGEGCDWTLGGLFNMHELEVIDEAGKAHPRFEIATPEQAREHAARSRAHV